MEKILKEENGAGDLSDIRELLDAEAEGAVPVCYHCLGQ